MLDCMNLMEAGQRCMMEASSIVKLARLAALQAGLFGGRRLGMFALGGGMFVS